MVDPLPLVRRSDDPNVAAVVEDAFPLGKELLQRFAVERIVVDVLARPEDPPAIIDEDDRARILPGAAPELPNSLAGPADMRRFEIGDRRRDELCAGGLGERPRQQRLPGPRRAV